jgi:hypothetical protein
MYGKFVRRATEEGNPDPTTSVQEAFNAVDNSLDYFETVAELERLLGIRYEYEKARADPYLAQLMESLRREAKELGLELVKARDLQRFRKAEDRLREVERQLSELKTGRERLERERGKPPTPPPAPPPPALGLGAEELRRVEDRYRRTFAEAGTLRLPPGAEASLRDELASLREELKAVPRERALELALGRIGELARSLIALPAERPPAAPRAPPPPERPAVYVRPAELLGPRIPRIVTRSCWIPGCTEVFEADEDLEKRVRLVPVLVEDTPGRGPTYEPLLRFPPLFYMLCPGHRHERFGYRDVWDALGYLVAETRRSMAQRLTVTEETLRELGLSNGDIAIIRSRAERWRGFPKPS